MKKEIVFFSHGEFATKAGRHKDTKSVSPAGKGSNSNHEFTNFFDYFLITQIPIPFGVRECRAPLPSGEGLGVRFFLFPLWEKVLTTNSRIFSPLRIGVNRGTAEILIYYVSPSGLENATPFSLRGRAGDGLSGEGLGVRFFMEMFLLIGQDFFDFLF